MRHTKVASRYAKSLLGFAAEKGELDQVYADMELVAATCDQCRDFELLLNSPIVKTDKKEAIITEVFKGKLTKMSAAFMDIITRKRREYLLFDIATEFVRQYKAAKNIVIAEVSTAVGLDEKLRKKVFALVEGDNVEIIENVDEELIGGVIVRVGDKQVDASILRQINELRKDFAKNPYVRDY